MDRYPLRASLDLVMREVMTIPLQPIQDGAGSSHFNGPEGWIYGLENRHLEMITLVTDYPNIYAAVNALTRTAKVGPVKSVMVNKLRAHGDLKKHRDGASPYLRFHLPIITHPEIVWWDEVDGTQHMEVGQWYGPVHYSGVLHSMHNPTPIDRIHIVADYYIGEDYELIREKARR